MSIYTKSKGLKNSKIYRRDGKMIKTADTPGNVMALLETQDSVNDENLKLEKPTKPCIFCGMHSKLSRTINQEVVVICEAHYYEKTTGQIVQQVRLNADALLAKQTSVT